MTGGPTADFDASFIDRFGSLGGVDEVGRGAVAGPLAVGLVVVDGTRAAPAGLKDSKLLSAKARALLVPRIRQWSLANAVGWASPTEVSDQGIMAALRLATWRALHLVQVSLRARGLPETGALLIDGNYDWMGTEDLFSTSPHRTHPATFTQVKGDRVSQAVAAASVLAKVHRDTYMSEVADPGYGWASNKGYATKSHTRAIADLGLSRQHRRGWNLAGLA